MFEKIKANYNVKIFTNTISRVGKASKLNKNETSINFSNFRKFLKNFEAPFDFKKLIRPVSACLYPTLFPNGDLHLCCIKRENTKICNINTDDFSSSLKDFNKNWKSNILSCLLNSSECNNCKISK